MNFKINYSDGNFSSSENMPASNGDKTVTLHNAFKLSGTFSKFEMSLIVFTFKRTKK